MKRLTGALVFVFGVSLLYLGTFGLQGFGLRLSLTGDCFREDFNSMSNWYFAGGSGDTAIINPAGYCSFITTGSCQYLTSAAVTLPTTNFTVELKLRINSWTSSGEFYLWFQQASYAHLLSITPTRIRVATPSVDWRTCTTETGKTYVWTWTLDWTHNQQKVYQNGTLIGTWTSFYTSSGASYLSFNSGSAIDCSIDRLYIDYGVKPPSVSPPVVRNSLLVKGRYGGVAVGSFTVTLRNSSYTYPIVQAPSIDGYTFPGLVTGITWTADATYLLHPATNSCVLPTSPTPYVLWLDFGSAPAPQGSIQVVGYESGVPVSGFEAWYTNGSESAHKTASTTSGVSFSNLKTGITYTIHGIKGAVTATPKDVSVVNPTTYDASLTFDSVTPQVGSVRVLGKQGSAYIAGFEAWLTNGTSGWSTLHVTAIVASEGCYFTNLGAGTYSVHGKLSGVEAPTNTTYVVLPQSQVPVSVVTFSSPTPPVDDWLALLKQYLADPTVKAGMQWIGGLFSLMGFLIMLFGGGEKKQPVYMPQPW